MTMKRINNKIEAITLIEDGISNQLVFTRQKSIGRIKIQSMLEISKILNDQLPKYAFLRYSNRS